jgi:regulatory factor X
VGATLVEVGKHCSVSSRRILFLTMPPQRNSRQSRSRSRSINTLPPRPGSSHSTTSLRSAPTEPGQPYPRPVQRIAASQPRSPTDAELASMDHANLAHMLQVENVQLSQQGMPHMTDDSGRMLVSSAPQMQQQMQHNFYQQQQGMPSFPQVNMAYFPVPHGHHGVAPQPVYHEHQVQPVEPEPRRPRQSTGQTNESELKDMLQRNSERSLDEVANDVVANERTTSAEKSKQLFAMLWYDISLRLTLLT